MSAEWTSRQKKGKTERVLGLGRRTREEIIKWNQMTALRFQTGGRHQKNPASFLVACYGITNYSREGVGLKQLPGSIVEPLFP